MRHRKLLATLALVLVLGIAFPNTASAEVPLSPRIVQLQELPGAFIARFLTWLDRTTSQWLSGFQAAEGASMTSNG